MHRITVPSIRKPILISAGFVAAALGLGLILQQFLAVSNIALVFLTAVLASAITCGLWPALFACLISVLAYNFFFLPPLYTFTIADPENHVALFFFTVVAVIASQSDGADTRRGGHRPAAREDDRGSVSVRPQARHGCHA